MPFVCVIDDDMVSQYTTRYCIHQYNSSVEMVVFDSAEEALDHFSILLQSGSFLPEVIFLDLVMHSMSGWEFLDALEAILLEHPSRNPEIYLLSSFEYASDRARAKGHPMIKGHFNKPLNKVNLKTVFAKPNPYESKNRRGRAIINAKE